MTDAEITKKETTENSSNRGLLIGGIAAIGAVGAGIAYLLIRTNLKKPRQQMLDEAKQELYSAGSRAMRFPVVERMVEKKMFKGISLPDVDLSGAFLRDADLQGADLRGADLTEAKLSMAKLKASNLTGTTLHDADLSFADLTGANVEVDQLKTVRSLEGAILPDGTELPGPRGVLAWNKPHWKTVFDNWANSSSA